MRADYIVRTLIILLIAFIVAGIEACPLDKDYRIGAQASSSPSPTPTVSPSGSPTPTVSPSGSPTDSPTGSSSSSPTVSPTDSPLDDDDDSSALTNSSNQGALISALSMLSGAPSVPENLNETAAKADREKAAALKKGHRGSGHLGKALSGDEAADGDVVPGSAVDSDRDGVADWRELQDGYDPNDPTSLPAPTTFLRSFLSGSDNDGDGLSNQAELELGTNPNRADTDGDGVIDGAEILSQSDPLDSASTPSPDRDKDGLSDQVESERGTNPANADTDGDKATDALELAIGTDPLSPDTDRDGFLDGLELRLGSNPLAKD